MMEETTMITEMDEIETTTEIVSTTTEPSTTTTTTVTTEAPITTTELPITSTTEDITTTTSEDPSQNTTPITYIFKFTPPTTTNSDIDEDNSTTKEATTEETTTDEISSTTEEVTVRPTARSKRGRSRFKRSDVTNNTMRIPRSPVAYEISAYDESPSYFGFQASQNPSSGPQPDTIDYETKLTPVPNSDSKDDVFNHFFYLTHYETIQVPYKFYNTILRFTYVEAIRTSVLELELDSDNYNLMIFLPDYDYGLDNLLAAMKSNYVPSLRDIKKSMKQQWVKAIVPKFNLKGNIILTSDLQQMGIEEIFEPTHADFTPMTEEKMIYARHIEQTVTVNIRTQSTEHFKS